MKRHPALIGFCEKLKRVRWIGQTAWKHFNRDLSVRPMRRRRRIVNQGDRQRELGVGGETARIRLPQIFQYKHHARQKIVRGNLIEKRLGKGAITQQPGHGFLRQQKRHLLVGQFADFIQIGSKSRNPGARLVFHPHLRQFSLRLPEKIAPARHIIPGNGRIFLTEFVSFQGTGIEAKCDGLPAIPQHGGLHSLDAFRSGWTGEPIVGKSHLRPQPGRTKKTNEKQGRYETAHGLRMNKA